MKTTEMMHAAVLHAVGDLRYEEVAKPAPGEGEVLLEIAAAGICGSDLPRVLTKGTYHFPTIPGHEFAGVIREAQDPALIGRHAAVFPLLPCRKCPACQVGEYANCEHYDYYGSRRDGGFAEYLAVDTRNLVLLDDSIPLDEASLMEPSAVARAAVRRMQITLGDKVVLFGAGPIGLVAAGFARMAGASAVRVVDISDEKLAFARRFGFEAYDKERDGLFDVALEGTGAGAALGNAILSLKTHGRLVLMGNPFGDMTIPAATYSQILRRELTLCGTWNSSYNDRINDWRAVADVMAKGEFPFRELITHRYPLSGVNDAFAMMSGKKEFYTKVTLICNEELTK